MSMKKTLGVLGIFIIGIVIGIVVNTYSPMKLGISGSDVSPKIEKLYELINPGVDIGVVKIDDISGIYKVLVKVVDVAGTTSYREVFVTKDGKFLSESMVQVDQSIIQLDKVRSFVDCLTNKSVVIAGLTNQTATMLQFNVLGGSYATKLYLSCDGDLAQQCVDAGITQVPAVIYQGKGYPGVQSISWFESLTGCKF